MFKKIEEIGNVFRIPGTLYTFEIITNGNINTTYKVTYLVGNKKLKSYIFQRINEVVFKNAEDIMENIDKITSHIHNNYPKEIVLHFHHTDDGNNYYRDAEGNFWRVMNNVDSITFNTCDDLLVVTYTGRAFGHFQNQLSDFDGTLLHETIPDFHNTKKRLDKLFEDEKLDSCGRVAEVREELDYIHSVYDMASKLSVQFSNGEIPVRVTHNDTKSNNVLFDRYTKEPLVVIDLDTVMPGMAMYDFADAVRFIANTSDEDEPDTSRVFFDTSKFRAFCRGYLKEVKDALTEYEIESLVLASFSITIELASRFLDDYITGDKYFKVNYPVHNLVRTRCQLKLAQDILKKQEELDWIVKDVLETYSIDNA